MRTFWMRLFAAGNAALLAVFVYFFFAFVLPNASRADAAPFVPVFGAFIALFTVIILAALAWPGGLRRRWFWILGATPAVLILLLFAPQIVFDLAHPTLATSFIPTVIAITASLLTVCGGVIAFRQVSVLRAAGVPRPTALRTRLALSGIVGLLLGAVATSLAAGASVTGGGSVSEAPTRSTTITAKDTKFVETSFAMKDGEVLGIFVINRDGSGHSFDIDALNVHVALPANSTTAVAIKPTAAGTIEFFCAIPGHRQSGMVGTIDVQ